jgi:hypothetical protein
MQHQILWSDRCHVFLWLPSAHVPKIGSVFLANKRVFSKRIQAAGNFRGKFSEANKSIVAVSVKSTLKNWTASWKRFIHNKLVAALLMWANAQPVKCKGNANVCPGSSHGMWLNVVDRSVVCAQSVCWHFGRFLGNFTATQKPWTSLHPQTLYLIYVLY